MDRSSDRAMGCDRPLSPRGEDAGEWTGAGRWRCPDGHGLRPHRSGRSALACDSVDGDRSSTRGARKSSRRHAASAVPALPHQLASPRAGDPWRSQPAMAIAPLRCCSLPPERTHRRQWLSGPKRLRPLRSIRGRRWRSLVRSASSCDRRGLSRRRPRDRPNRARPPRGRAQPGRSRTVCHELPSERARVLRSAAGSSDVTRPRPNRRGVDRRARQGGELRSPSMGVPSGSRSSGGRSPRSGRSPHETDERVRAESCALPAWASPAGVEPALAA